jgi:hypothetical protein
MHPFRGEPIYSSALNPRYSQKTLIGYIKDIEGNICNYTRVDGMSDCFIWKFKDGFNSNVIIGDSNV